MVRVVLLFTLLLVTTASADDFLASFFERRESPPEPEVPGCVANGQTYMEGETYKIECNECRCINGGSACTRKACLGCTHDGIYYDPNARLNSTCTCVGNDQIACTTWPNLPPSRCYYNGKMYRKNDKFREAPCNHCSCEGNDTVICTTLDCDNPMLRCSFGGLQYEDGETVLDRCNKCVCRLGMTFICTKFTCL